MHKKIRLIESSNEDIYMFMMQCFTPKNLSNKRQKVKAVLNYVSSHQTVLNKAQM